MADLSKVKIGDSTYTLKDAQARTDVATAQGAISAEVTRAKGIESGLDTRIQNLEARGRYLSTWDTSIGKPADYPEIPGSATTTYTYEFKAGDYYIINKVDAENKYMPDGASIVANKVDGTWTWTVGKKAYTGSDALVVGGQFVYSTAGWNYVATAKDIAWGNITGTLSSQTDLQAALNEKVDNDNLGELAYKDSATTKYTPAGAISQIDATPAGTIALGAFTQTSTAATISASADYTPAGTVAGTVKPTGTITVNPLTQTATDITSTGTFTPVGTVAAVEGGNFSALKTATFAETTDGATGSVKIDGEISKPDITVNDDSTDTFVKSLKAGDVDAASIDTSKFSGGSFTGATQASYTQGTKASFTQGSKASLSTSNISYVESGVEVAVDETDKEMLVFTNVTAKSAKAVDTFTANGDDTFTPNGNDSFTANNVGSFTAASIGTGFFSAQKLPVVDGTAAAVTSVTAELANAPEFTGKSYIVNTTADTALKTVAFTGTEGNVSVAGQYDKATSAGASFTGDTNNISATFSGTERKALIPTEIKYDKATANGATFTGTENKVTPTFTGSQADITVS